MFPVVSLAAVVPVLYLGMSGTESLAGVLVGGFFLGIARHRVRGRRPVRQRLVPAGATGHRDRHLRRGHGRHRDQRAHHGAADRRRSAPRRPSSSPPACWSPTASWRPWSCATHPAGSAPTGSLAQRLGKTLRLRITWQASALYALAFGGYVAFSVYLPTYLKTAYSLDPTDAANRMAGFVLVAVVMRPVGGFLSDRLDPVPVLGGGLRRRHLRRGAWRRSRPA